MSDLDDLIKEIAAKHHIAVGRDDPILILRTMNAKLLEDGTRAQKENLDRLEERLGAILTRLGDESKTRAERIVNAGLSASRKMMAEGAKSWAEEIGTLVRNEVEGALEKIETCVGSSRKVAYLNIAAAMITFAAAFMVVWSR